MDTQAVSRNHMTFGSRLFGKKKKKNSIIRTACLLNVSLAASFSYMLSVHEDEFFTLWFSENGSNAHSSPGVIIPFNSIIVRTSRMASSEDWALYPMDGWCQWEHSIPTIHCTYCSLVNILHGFVK